MDRREFLGTSISALGLSLLSVSCSSLVSKSLAPNSKGSGTIVTADAVNGETLLTFINLTTGDQDVHALPLRVPHSIYRNYLNPDEIFVFEILGDAVIYNTKTRVVKKAKQGSEALFYGHSKQMGEVIWCTERRGNAHFVRRYSIHDLSPIPGNSQIFNAGHSVSQVPGLPVLVTGGIMDRTGFVSFIDTESGKLMQTITLPTTFPVHFMGLNSEEVVFSACSTCKNSPKIKSPDEKKEHAAMTLPGFENITSDPVWHIKKAGNIWQNAAAMIDPVHSDVVVGGLFVTKISANQFVTSHEEKNALALWSDGQVKHVFSAAEPGNMCLTPDKKKLIINGKEGLSIYDLDRPDAQCQLIPGTKKLFVTCLANEGVIRPSNSYSSY